MDILWFSIGWLWGLTIQTIVFFISLWLRNRSTGYKTKINKDGSKTTTYSM